jgi:polygalacturonase
MIQKLMVAGIALLMTVTGSAQQIYNVMTYGAKGDGKTNDAPAIQKAIDACSKSGSGRVLFHAGHVFMASPFNLKSGIDLHVEAGAKILANPNENVYSNSAFRDNPGEGTIWIGGENIQNVSISGQGEIDGNGVSFMGKELEDSYVLKPFMVLDPRPHVLTIINGKNIRIKDVHIGNSAYWTIHLVGCNDVVITGLTLLNSLKVRNGDGIDIDHSKNVRISDCIIESGDDCICLKNRREYDDFGNCENIEVSNCTMTSRSCAIKIGSENVDTIRKVVFRNCIIKNSNRGLGIQNRDEGVVYDVLFSNITIESHLFSDVWWGKAEPIYVTAYRRARISHKDANWRFPKNATQGRVGAVYNITFSNIKCTSENGIYVSGESPDKITNITFDSVDVLINKTTSFPGGIYDRRPADVEGFTKGRTSGFYVDQAQQISLRNCSVQWGNNRPEYYSHAAEAHGVAGFSAGNLQGIAAFPDKLKPVLEETK